VIEECGDPKCGCHQLAWMREMERIELEVFPGSRSRGEVFVCIVDESAGLAEEEKMPSVQEAASKLKEIAAAIGALDFSQEIEQIQGAVASIQAEIGAVADQLLGAEPGEEVPEPSGSENVDLAAAEAAAGEGAAGEEGAAAEEAGDEGAE